MSGRRPKQSWTQSIKSQTSSAADDIEDALQYEYDYLRHGHQPDRILPKHVLDELKGLGYTLHKKIDQRGEGTWLGFSSSMVFFGSYNRRNPITGMNEGSERMAVKMVRVDYNLLSKVFMKIFPKEDENEVEQISREMYMINVADHPNVVSKHGISSAYRYFDPAESTAKLYEEPKRLMYAFFFMECADGNLRWFMRNREANSERQTAQIMSQIAHGVQYLHHDLGVAHRNLKPENILIFCDPRSPQHGFQQRYQFKIADFGVAYIASEHRNPINRNDLVGTFFYKAPEVTTLPPDGYAPFKLDIWSLAIMMAELVATTVNTIEAIDYACTKEDFSIELVNSLRTKIQMSYSLADLLVGMLEFEFDQRLPIDSVIQHPWLKAVGYEESTNLGMVPHKEFNYKVRGFRERTELEQPDNDQLERDLYQEEQGNFY